MRMQFVEIALILQISTTRISMATNFEIGDCRMLLSNRTEGQPETPLALLGFIVTFGDGVFPNLRISLQILLTIQVSIASCERSFSKLKLILSYARASMGQDRLSDLALLSVERKTLEKQILMT